MEHPLHDIVKCTLGFVSHLKACEGGVCIFFSSSLLVMYSYLAGISVFSGNSPELKALRMHSEYLPRGCDCTEKAGCATSFLHSSQLDETVCEYCVFSTKDVSNRESLKYRKIERERERDTSGGEIDLVKYLT